jgi:ABC-type dipeptide/oligopeptide/nickel transport system permease component
LLLATIIAAALLAGAFVRLAPGYGMDERRMDLRLSAASLEALEQRDSSLERTSGWFEPLFRLLRLDWGESATLRRPVRQLLAERAVRTLETLGSGLTLAWAFAAAACVMLLSLRSKGLDRLATFIAGILVCLPAAVVALLFLQVDGGPRLVLATIMLPRVFRYSRNILDTGSRRAHVLAARARGVGSLGLLFRHIGLPALPELLALAGVSVSMACGAVIPVEAICDSPGVGQLMWQAAMGRDIVVLVDLTVVVAVLTCAANLLSDAGRALSKGAA